MTQTLLSCVAEEAKPVSQFAADQRHHGGMSELGWIDNADFGYQFIPKTLREVSTEEDSPALFYLFDSNVCPDKQEGFKIELQDSEPLKSDFINAFKEQCQSWAQEKWHQVNFIEMNVIANCR